ncbi:hypothetical protein YC2023_112151 [Brassica napus]
MSSGPSFGLAWAFLIFRDIWFVSSLGSVVENGACKHIAQIREGRSGCRTQQGEDINSEGVNRD